MCLLGGVGGSTPQIFLKLQESWSKIGHAAIEMAIIYYVTFFIRNSILLRKMSWHISARRQLTSFEL